MSETLTLPCGVVMTAMPMLGTKGGLWTYPDYRALLGGIPLRIYQGHEGRWYASCVGGGYGGYATMDAAVSALDRDVRSLRAALLPADARERVARALWDRWHATAWALAGDDREPYLSSADAVLAALGIGGAR